MVAVAQAIVKRFLRVLKNARNGAMPPETMAGTGQTLCAELDMMNSSYFFIWAFIISR